jgi:HD-GYP domain-containing protein (c-di-GMP phosphodiesterase class II)
VVKTALDSSSQVFVVAMMDYRRHACARPVEAALFRAASHYEPALEGLMRAHISKRMLIEREKCTGDGIGALLKAAVARLASNGKKEQWGYTKRHSLEVASFVYVMSKEALRQGVPDAKGLKPEVAFAGGLVHDVGKTFLPLAIVVKELGVDLLFFSAFKGARLRDVERRLLREEHLAAGTRYVRLYGGGGHIRVMFDMVGLHHVMYNGRDTGVPSYPSLLRGKDLPFHSRIAKAADFISAVLPRHYRQDEWISSLDEAVAYATVVAGREIDPLAIRCFMTGFYDVSQKEADVMIERLTHPDGQAGISDLKGARRYAKKIVLEDPEFRSMIKNHATEKLRQYQAEVERLMEGYGLEKFEDAPLGK